MKRIYKSHRTGRQGSGDESVSRFDIWPNRSLDGRQIKVLLAITAVAVAFVLIRSAAIHHLPLVIGPVVTVSGLAFALWWNNRTAASTGETVEISPGIVRVSRRIGRRVHPPMEFHTAWVRLSVTDDRRVSNRITLSESGRSCSIGDFLSPEERLELARALDASLSEARRPQTAA